MSTAATVPEYTPRTLITFQGAGKLTVVEEHPPPGHQARRPDLYDILARPVLGRAFDDPEEEMLPGREPVEPDGSTWERFQDESRYPPWL